MLKIFTCYDVGIGLVYHTDEGMRETQLHQHFIAPTQVDALKISAAWGREREKSLNLCHGVLSNYYKFSSMKVGTYSVLPPEKNGFIKSGYNGTFFEWKIDWPGSLDEYIGAASQRIVARSKR